MHLEPSGLLSWGVGKLQVHGVPLPKLFADPHPVRDGEYVFKNLPAAFSSNGWEEVAIIVHPVDHGRPPVPSEVPEDYAKDYDEACAVLQVSPQSTAALARRLLQALLRGPGKIPSGKNLAEEIKAAKGTLSPLVWEALNTLRQMGNFAAHEQRDKGTGVVLPIERHEAEFALDVVERLFDEYFVAPAKVAAAKAKFNAAKMGPAGKKPIP